MNPSRSNTLRTLLLLGRVSNLPTVWTNCLAGWWLGGAGTWLDLGLLCLGASMLYVGGMFLNDAFDADFDRQHRKERPIPSGAIAVGAVWGWGIGWLVLGAACLLPHGFPTAVLVVLLIGAILIYDAIHKWVAFSPVLMALCRFLLVLVAASYGQLGVGGLAIWSALVMAGYIVGLSYLARRESTSGLVGFWPLLPLLAPLVLAWVVNAGEHRSAGLVLSLLLLLWITKSLAPLFQRPGASIGRAVASLLAGICLVDLLAVADVPKVIALMFLGCFGLSLVFQRYVPAT